MEVFAAKNILRQQIKRALKELSASDRRNQSTEVTKKVLNHPKYIASKGVSVFISLKDEVDTSDIIKDIFSSGKKCFIPRYSEGGDHMTMVRIHSIQELINLPKTKWNIPQPLESEEREDCLKTGGLDLILVPGLCFTKEGWRLGRGKGYYDNFIKKNNQQFEPPFLLGLALAPSVVDFIPCTPNDMKLDEVISPINFS